MPDDERKHATVAVEHGDRGEAVELTGAFRAADKNERQRVLSRLLRNVPGNGESKARKVAVQQARLRRPRLSSEQRSNSDGQRNIRDRDTQPNRHRAMVDTQLGRECGEG
jgi:hypothetical protein